MRKKPNHHAFYQHEKITKTSEDMRSLLIEALTQQNFTFIDQYAKSIGVYREAIVKNIHRWYFQRTVKVGNNSEYDMIIASVNKDLSFKERYQAVMNYVDAQEKKNVTFFTQDTLQES
jgi:hypothetical protein